MLVAVVVMHVGLMRCRDPTRPLRQGPGRADGRALRRDVCVLVSSCFLTCRLVEVL